MSVDLEPKFDDVEPGTVEPGQAAVIEEPTLDEPQQFDVEGLIQNRDAILNEKKLETQKRKQLESELAQMRAEKKNANDNKLKEQNEYKELYEQEKKEKLHIQAQSAAKDEALVKREKKAAVMNELGKLRQEKYADFIDFDGVIIDENGNCVPDSVKLVANKYRNEYPELIVGNRPAVLNHSAAVDGTPAPTKKKTVKELTQAEKTKIRRDAYDKSNNANKG